VDTERANELLRAESRRIHELLAQARVNASDERSGANALGDMSDAAPPLIAEQEEESVSMGLRERLSAIERAQQRLLSNTYGVSVRSGEPLSDERLEADSAAELTTEEAASS
jgi:DnaK suppressor protein